MFYDKARFFITSKGNKISKQVLIKGSEKILIDGKTIIQTGSVLRVDLAQISMGIYTIIREECVIRPSYTKQ